MYWQPKSMIRNGISAVHQLSLTPQSTVQMGRCRRQSTLSGTLRPTSSPRLFRSYIPGVKFTVSVPPSTSRFYYDIDPAGNDHHRLLISPQIEKKMLELARQKNADQACRHLKGRCPQALWRSWRALQVRTHHRARGRAHHHILAGLIHRPLPWPAYRHHRTHQGCEDHDVSQVPTGAATKREQLIRVYGITFPKQKMLDEVSRHA